MGKIKTFEEFKQIYFPKEKEKAEAELLNYLFENHPNLYGQYSAKRMFSPNLTVEAFLRQTDKGKILLLFYHAFFKRRKENRVTVIQPRMGRQIMVR